MANFAYYFEKYPKLNSVTWKCYTPYFNDGDPCTYEIHADYDDNESYGLVLNKYTSCSDSDVSWYKECGEEISKYVYTNHEIMEMVVPSDNEITVNRDLTYKLEEYTTHD